MKNRWFIDKIRKAASNYPNVTFSKKGSAYSCVNPFSYHLVRKNAKLYNSLDGLYVDGMLMCMMVNMLWKAHVPRLSFDMTGMAEDLFERLDKSGESIYFIGDRQEALEAAISQIKAAFPNMNIVGFRNGFFDSDEDRAQAIKTIVDLNPDFTVIGMGSPIQEQFAVDLRDAGYQGIGFTCGGFLHQTDKSINYYPEWVDKYNLRAFYRLGHEKGLWKRLFNVLIQFPGQFVFDTLATKFKKPKPSYAAL